MAAGVPNPVRELLRDFGVMERQLAELVRLGQTGAGLAALQARMGRLRAAIRRLGDASDAWAAARVGGQWTASARAAQRTLVEAGLLEETRLLRFEVRAAQRLVTAVRDRLAHVRRALLEGLVEADPKTITGVLIDGLREDGALVAVVDGVLKVQTPAGELWDPRAYAKMVARTAIADARREAFRYRYLANGVDVVIVDDTGSDHPECQVWEGELLSLTGITPGLPTVDEARAAGLFHPNCTHRYTVAPQEDQPGAEETQALALDEGPMDRSVLGNAPGDPRGLPPNLR